MKITLESVRSILRESLGRESFVASFIKSVKETDSCPTASISSEGVLQYNPGFASKYIACDEDLFCLVMHEIKGCSRRRLSVLLIGAHASCPPP